MGDEPPIFGLLISGRMVHADFVRINETDFAIEIPDAHSMNHLAVFLTGSVPLPEGYGASVYIRWADNADSSWHYLGSICNMKPSAFFRVGAFANAAGAHGNVFSNHFSGSAGSAQIGISVELLTVIEGRVAAASTAVSNKSNFEEFQEKAIRNLVNYAQSFVRKLPNPDEPGRYGSYIPVETIDKWYQSFKHRLQINPNFWKSLNSFD